MLRKFKVTPHRDQIKPTVKEVGDQDSCDSSGDEFRDSSKNMNGHRLTNSQLLHEERRVTRSKLKKRREPAGKSMSQPLTKKKRHNAGASTEASINGSNGDFNAEAQCPKCLQFRDRIEQWPGDPDDAITEFMLLGRSDLLLEDVCVGNDLAGDRPTVRITMFSVYDEDGHMCSFDKGLIEKGVNLYMSGYVKPIINDDPTTEDGVYVKRIGPLLSWWISGFDGGSKALVGITSDYVHYFLLSATHLYAPYLTYERKVMLSKLTIDFLQTNPTDSYEELVDYIQETDSSLDGETLLLHASFVVAQIESYDAEADNDEIPLISTRAARRLKALTGERIRRPKEKNMATVASMRKKQNETRATTTPFVFSLFSSFFGDKLNATASTNLNSKRCGACKGKPKCCKKCENSKKNKANDKSVDDFDDETDDEGIEDDMDRQANKSTQKSSQRKIQHDDEKASTVKWKSPHVKLVGETAYYSSVLVDNILINIGDCLLFKPDIGEQPYVGKVQFMFEDKEGREKMLHVSWFWRGSDTVLGEVANKFVVYLTNECDSVPAGSVLRKCNVEYLKPDKDFGMSGGSKNFGQLNGFSTIADDCFYYRMRYDHTSARFEDIPEKAECENINEKFRFCTSCFRRDKQEEFESTKLGKRMEGSKTKEYSSFTMRGEKYAVGECVFIDPVAYPFLPSRTFASAKTQYLPDNNPGKYPERYRKVHDHVCGGNVNVPDPFIIGRILSIHDESTTRRSSSKTNRGQISAAIFYRPENTCLGTAACYTTDYNILYWTEKTITVPLSMVMSKCVVAYGKNIKDLESFRLRGPHRFYFNEAYNIKQETFIEVPEEAKSFSGKGQDQAYKDYPPVHAKLRSLDIFSGCGGLSDGFHRAGISETLWAIENNAQAAQAFKLNNPICNVFNEDCNHLLNMVMEGKRCYTDGRPLPQKGEVDIIMGGPPCQGFSGMNRFNTREYSQFKNSLIATFLSYLEFYRPKYFVLENVRNFVSYKRNMVLKTVVDALVEMGYQTTFAVLQAGHYGIPQTRRRLIILAAAPGYKLPKYPEPDHVFSTRGSQLSLCIDEAKIMSNIRWINSAPYRCVTVQDAINDLPKIECNEACKDMKYDRPPVSHYQKMMRDNGNVLKHHVTKPMNELNLARFRNIPTVPGADWRDLPNVRQMVNGHVIAEKLQYTHFLKDKTKRGVCSCAEGLGTCKPIYRQANTLIPWCLPHTGYRHNQWFGLFGRLSLDGYFCTTITNPEPMGKQGCVIHPTEHRVVSVRECARSQGFTDSYRFYGSTLDCYRQVGNAVPPPLSRALGMEFRKILANTP